MEADKRLMYTTLRGRSLVEVGGPFLPRFEAQQIEKTDTTRPENSTQMWRWQKFDQANSAPRAIG